SSRVEDGRRQSKTPVTASAWTRDETTTKSSSPAWRREIRARTYQRRIERAITDNYRVDITPRSTPHELSDPSPGPVIGEAEPFAEGLLEAGRTDGAGKEIVPAGTAAHGREVARRRDDINAGLAKGAGEHGHVTGVGDQDHLRGPVLVNELCQRQ